MVVICGGPLAIATIKLVVAVCAVGVVESVTMNPNRGAVATVGVPLISPVDAFSVKPVGSDPSSIPNVYGAVPPIGTPAAFAAAVIDVAGA